MYTPTYVDQRTCIVWIDGARRRCASYCASLRSTRRTAQAQRRRSSFSSDRSSCLLGLERETTMSLEYLATDAPICGFCSVVSAVVRT
jgi:hypothetical protein